MCVLCECVYVCVCACVFCAMCVMQNLTTFLSSHLTHTCTHIHTCAHMHHSHTHMHSHIHTTRTCTHTRALTYTHVHTCTTHTYTLHAPLTHTHALTYTHYTHMHSHTHAHTCALVIRPDDSATLNDCIQMVFSQTNRGHLLLLYSREIVILDTSIRQIIASMPLERNTSSFLQIMPCRQRDVLYALHENGCISLRIRAGPQTIQPSSSPLDLTKVSEIQYYTHTHSEPLRISKSCQILSAAVCPITELDAAVFTSEGKILFWAVKFDHYGMYGQELSDEAPPTVLAATPGCGNALLSGEETRVLAGGVALTLQDYLAPRSFVPPQGMGGSVGWW